MRSARGRVGILIAVIAAAGSLPLADSEMHEGYAVRGCSNYVEWSPVYQETAEACLAYCSGNNADACEWQSSSGDCYVEFGYACYLEGGHPGWYATVLGEIPPQGGTTVLVNGSFDANPPWVQSNSLEYQSIQATWGVTPQHWPWTDNNNIYPPFYSDIEPAAGELAIYLANLPSGDIHVVTHSHGGNVAIRSTHLMSRELRHLINLGTPIADNLARTVSNAGVVKRCTASSADDEIQFLGSSEFQVGEYAYNDWWAWYYFVQAENDWSNGNYQQYYLDLELMGFYEAGRDLWWWSTKIEHEGETWVWQGLAHDDMHEPNPVWLGLYYGTSCLD